MPNPNSDPNPILILTLTLTLTLNVYPNRDQVMADLTGMRHGAVEELVPPRAADPRHTLRALVPLAHLLGYASSVRFTVSRASSK